MRFSHNETLYAALTPLIQFVNPVFSESCKIPVTIRTREDEFGL
jgi:hypothetical protein